MSRTKTVTIAALAIIATGLVVSLFVSGSEAPVQASEVTARPVQVEVVEVETSAFTNTIELPGRVTARRTAQVLARMAGVVLSQDFVEGSQVSKGQVLYHIDPAPFQASLAQAKADLAQAEASMIDLKGTADRYAALLPSGAICQQDYDTAQNGYKAALAARDAAKAAVRTAELNLGYATVTAPISGRIGRSLVTEGALVGQSESTHLVTIQQLDPIFADINQPVAEYLKLKAAMTDALDGKEKAKVTVHLDDVDYTAEGRLLFSDVTVDQDTGQVSLRSEFPNDRGMLLPGMFVRIRIALGNAAQAIFIPQRAVQIASNGAASVYVVDDQNVAHVRAVATGQMRGGDWRITDGLAPGEHVVVGGLAKVKDGAVVTVKNAQATQAGTVALAATATATATRD